MCRTTVKVTQEGQMEFSSRSIGIVNSCLLQATDLIQAFSNYLHCLFVGLIHTPTRPLMGACGGYLQRVSTPV